MNENFVDEVMHDYAGLDRPGASIIIVRDGVVVLRKAYGLADVENRIRATTSTNYRLASVTKAFTAAAILRLEEQGRLSLDDSAGLRDITIRHLLTHSSGLIDYEDIIPAGAEKQLRDTDVLTLVEQESSAYFAPGSSYRYSNSGYAILALIVEKVSGRSFAEFLREEIFLPLGMRDTVAHREGQTTVRRRAYGYSRERNIWRRSDQNLTSGVLGDGGVYSSVDDLAKWLEALDRGQFAAAAVPRVVTDDPAVRYGYGWRVTEREGRKIVMHTGETIGFRNAVVRYPDEKSAVVVLTNRDEGDPLSLASALHGA